MSVKICCDFCNKPVQYKVVITETGMEFHELIDVGRTRELNTRKMFPLLCKSCAEKLDQVVDLARETWLKEIDISYRNQNVNRARRELLGTDG